MIRAARPSDLETIAELGQFAFTGSALSPPSIERARAIVAQTFARGFVIVAEDAGAIIGSMGLARGQWEHSGEAYLRDLWTHAAAGDLRALIEASRAVAAEIGVPLYLGVNRRERMSAAMRLYQQLGGELASATFRF